MVSVDALERALARLDERAPRARTQADAGDPAPLARVIDHALAGDRVLTDEGALRELSALAPAAAERFASYLAFPFSREAKIRASFATIELTVGKSTWRCAEVMARLRMGEAAERAAALASLESVVHLLDGLEAIAPEPAPRRRAPATESARHGSILLPTPELMADLGLVASAAAPRVEDGPDRSRELGELLLGLSESALGRPALEYGELRVAGAGRAVADFRVRHPLVGGQTLLPFEQPGAPLVRGTARVKSAGDAWSSAAALLGADPPAVGAALAFAATSPAFAGLFADAGRDRRRTARTVAAVLAALSLETHLVGRAATVEDLLDRERDAVGFSRPRLLARLLWIGARLEGSPGEEGARYAGGARLEEALGRGARLALDLRERFDEDWFRNPRVTPEVLDDGARASSGGIDQVIIWLKESL